MTKIKAYSYLRISNDQQKVGDGIRRQMEASKIYADQHGYDLVETMSDIGIKCVLKSSPNFSSNSQPRSDQDEKVRSPMYKSYFMGAA